VCLFLSIFVKIAVVFLMDVIFKPSESLSCNLLVKFESLKYLDLKHLDLKHLDLNH